MMEAIRENEIATFLVSEEVDRKIEGVEGVSETLKVAKVTLKVWIKNKMLRVRQMAKTKLLMLVMIVHLMQETLVTKERRGLIFLLNCKHKDVHATF